MSDRPVGLEHNPELAKRIGFVIGNYTHLEYYLFILYAALVTHMVDDVTAEHIGPCFNDFYTQRSIKRKTELLLAEAEPLMEEVLLQAVRRVCKRMKGAAKKRAALAHDGALRNAAGEWFRLTSTKQVASFEPLTDDYFKRLRDQYRTLGRDLTTLLTFVLPIEDRLMNLLRALPLPPGMPFPAAAEGPLPPPRPDETAELEASVARLQLQALQVPDS